MIYSLYWIFQGIIQILEMGIKYWERFWKMKVEDEDCEQILPKIWANLMVSIILLLLLLLLHCLPKQPCLFFITYIISIVSHPCNHSSALFILNLFFFYFLCDEDEVASWWDACGISVWVGNVTRMCWNTSAIRDVSVVHWSCKRDSWGGTWLSKWVIDIGMT